MTSSHQIKFSALNRSTKDEVTAVGTIENSALTNDEITASYSYFGKDFRSTFSYEILDMVYGIPGSPEGHIDGVDIVLNKNTQRFNFHKEVSLFNFKTFDIDQRFIKYDHSESEKGLLISICYLRARCSVRSKYAQTARFTIWFIISVPRLRSKRILLDS